MSQDKLRDKHIYPRNILNPRFKAQRLRRTNCQHIEKRTCQRAEEEVVSVLEDPFSVLKKLPAYWSGTWWRASRGISQRADDEPVSVPWNWQRAEKNRLLACRKKILSACWRRTDFQSTEDVLKKKINMSVPEMELFDYLLYIYILPVSYQQKNEVDGSTRNFYECWTICDTQWVVSTRWVEWWHHPTSNTPPCGSHMAVTT